MQSHWVPQAPAVITVAVAVTFTVGEMVTNDVCIIPRINSSFSTKTKISETYLLPPGSPFVLNQCSLTRQSVNMMRVPPTPSLGPHPPHSQTPDRELSFPQKAGSPGTSSGQSDIIGLL